MNKKVENKKREQLSVIKEMIASEDFLKAMGELQKVSEPNDPLVLQSNYSQLLKKMPKDSLQMDAIKIAFVATSSIEHFVDILKFWLAKEGFAAEIFVAEFDTVEQTLLDPQSDLYEFQPDIVWIFTNHRDVHFQTQSGAANEEIEEDVKRQVQRFVQLWKSVAKNSKSVIIQNNADVPLERSFGNFEGSIPWGRINLYRKFNCELTDVVEKGVVIFDLEHLSATFGKDKWFDQAYWYHSKHAFSLDALGCVAHQGAKAIAAVRGRFKKCLILDLDNTLWGGIVGDAGIEGITLGADADGEAFVDFQKYVLRLKERGVILAVCSKNDEATAKEVFEKHPDMQLDLNDVAIFKANWEDKASNIRSIAQELNIGLDALVFVDDNPAERELVRGMLPEVAVVDLPEDPANFVKVLDQARLFETMAFTDEDAQRSTLYQTNHERQKFVAQFDNLQEYLKSLEMTAIASHFDTFHLQRIVQLINKSNQFNLTTRRYTEGEVKSMMNDPRFMCRYYKLNDRFGDNGLISIVILEKNEDRFKINTWLMSCRVLSRGMEEFVHNDILRLAKEQNVSTVQGKYIPTKKNNLVRDHYLKLGYAKVLEEDGIVTWELPIGDEVKLHQTFIQEQAPNELATV